MGTFILRLVVLAAAGVVSAFLLSAENHGINHRIRLPQPSLIHRKNILSSKNMQFYASTGNIIASEPSDPIIVSDQSETAGKTHSSIPTTYDLIKFGLPTLGVWFLQPVLSLIDSLVIGRSKSLNSVAELAALGPGISWIDSTAYMFQFMGMATTILMNRGFLSEDPTELDRSVSHALFTSLAFGFILVVLQYNLAPNAIRILAGSSTELVPLAVKYSRLRSIGAIFALPTIVAQSSFLATKDATTPLLAVLFGAIFNIVGDILLVSYFNQGIAGAAIATFLAQAAGCLFLVFTGTIRICKHKGINLRDIRLLRPLIRIPSLKDALKFLTFCGPLFFVLLVKTVLWSYTTYAASLAGTHNLAAHQIVLNFFLLVCIFGDVISQMSQTFLPPLLKATSQDSLISLKQLLRRIFNISIVLGSLNTIVSLFLSQLAPQVFTKSVDVIQGMKNLSPYFVLSVFPNCILLGLEGSIIASEDTSFHTKFYVFLGVLFLAYQTIIRNLGFGTTGVWVGIAAYQWIRLLGFGWRVKQNVSRRLAVKD